MSLRTSFLASLLCLAASFAGAASLSISPGTIVDCSYGRGQATLLWSHTAPVRILVGDRNGTALTGFMPPPSGSATTGPWVSDGMVFVLVDEAGNELARATAKVSCGGSASAVDAALRAGGYFPLAVGNQWVFRRNDRLATSTYESWQITGTELIGEHTYFVVSPNGMRFRSDGNERIYVIQFPGAAEQLWLDPTSTPDPSALLKIRNRSAFSGPIGVFSDALTYETFMGGLIFERGTLVRGIGLVSSTASMMSGSSGGFDYSRDLVYARIDGKLRFEVASPSLQLSAESRLLDVSGKAVTNCAVPCYFAACGLVGFTDPPGTYKPCFQARIGTEGLSGDDDGAVADLDLIDGAGHSVYHTTLPITASDAASLQAVLFQQVPLYSTPNNPLPPGAYQLVARVKAPSGEEIASATLAIQVK